MASGTAGLQFLELLESRPSILFGIEFFSKWSRQQSRGSGSSFAALFSASASRRACSVLLQSQGSLQVLQLGGIDASDSIDGLNGRRRNGRSASGDDGRGWGWGRSGGVGRGNDTPIRLHAVDGLNAIDLVNSLSTSWCVGGNASIGGSVARLDIFDLHGRIFLYPLDALHGGCRQARFLGVGEAAENNPNREQKARRQIFHGIRF